MSKLVWVVQGVTLVVVGLAIVGAIGLVLFPAPTTAALSRIGVDAGATLAQFVRPAVGPLITSPPLAVVRSSGAIHVPLAARTLSQGFISIVKFGGTTTADRPYGSSVSFQDMTIVAIAPSDQHDANGLPRHVWVGLSTAGDALEREATGRTNTDYDGTVRPQFIYRGLTVWLLVTDEVVVSARGAARGSQGIRYVLSALQVGRAISFNASINQYDARYQQLNLASFERLERSVGRPNDRLDPSFVFLINSATVDSN